MDDDLNAINELEEQPAAQPGSIAVAVFRALNAAEIDTFAWPFDELAERIKGVRTYADKASCPLIKLARFGEQRSDRGSLRHDANVLEVSGIEGDYDGEKVSLADAQVLLYEHSIAGVLYTSPSHT